MDLLLTQQTRKFTGICGCLADFSAPAYWNTVVKWRSISTVFFRDLAPYLQSVMRKKDFCYYLLLFSNTVQLQIRRLCTDISKVIVHYN